VETKFGCYSVACGGDHSQLEAARLSGLHVGKYIYIHIYAGDKAGVTFERAKQHIFVASGPAQLGGSRTHDAAEKGKPQLAFHR